MEKVLQAALFLRRKFSSSFFSTLHQTYVFFVYYFAFAFLLLFSHSYLGSLRSVHFLFLAVIFSFYFFHIQLRVLLILAIPFVLQGIFFDFLRYIPFEWLQPIRVLEPYSFDQFLFALFHSGSHQVLNEYLLRFKNQFLDLICGFAYLIHVPAAVTALVFFWKKRSTDLAQRYASAFLLMNLFAFVTYLLYPAAPPWYVAKYGFAQPLGPVMGDPAGLIALDQILGYHLSTNVYSMGPVTFGAIPSMHAGFPTLALLYSFHLRRRYSLLIGSYASLMWFSALYLQHHYLIDILLGILYAVIAYLIIEKALQPFIRKIYKFLFERLIDQAFPPFLNR